LGNSFMEQAVMYGYDLAITHHSTKDVAATSPFGPLLGKSLIQWT
jgi:hypothetical protein